ncbi:hypothetical protein P4V05_28435 [Bacillus thuringiensis]|uniref:hypothetical protein n=1 Tax=Bacillus sp. ok061 TaxID=1761766 RepID=UPI0021561EBF|nr:hypothetical protein [Bacillus sp. ok061]MED1904021.1 hypothetical protein [Bacillus thuringiensis]
MNYPFRNLVFEGGGNQRYWICRSFRIFRYCKNILSSIERFGDMSAGAITATHFRI